MIRISKILLAITIALLALWQLPWCYAFLNTPSIHNPFTLYSGVCGDFIAIEHGENKEMVGVTPEGKNFSREETDSLLPFFYVRQLMTDGRLNDTIQGYAVNAREIQTTNFNFRTSAADLNKPVVPLYPLLESLSKRVDLVMPNDVFRLTDKGIEFIKMAENSVDIQKSELFTQAMLKKGFIFPARTLNGNPTVQKEYDEGYLIVDHAGKLFHLKMMQGRPYVRAIELPEGLNIKHVFITEFRDHKTLGFIQSEDNQFYVLNNKTYQIFNTGITDCDLDKYNLTIIGNMADWTLWLDKDDTREYYALDANNYAVIKKMVREFDLPSTFGLHFTDITDNYVYPRF